MNAQMHKERQTYQLQYTKTNWIGLQEFGKYLKGKTGYFVHLILISVFKYVVLCTKFSYI